MKDFEREEARLLQEKRITETVSKIRKIIMVLSGKGGVGKSSIAANIAVGMAEQNKRIGLMDIDLHGPSIPKVLGLLGKRPEISGDKIIPLRYSDNLKVLSMESFLDSTERAVIWRGPLKIGAIRQFFADVDWGELDYLIIDSPPGTGDEPLTIAQMLWGTNAIVVTTPQEISLADVHKSITFCKQVKLEMLGLIENMSGYVCPHCNKESELFGVGGGERLAQQTGVRFLGRIPFDSDFVKSTDSGKPFITSYPERAAAKALKDIIGKIIEILPT